MCQSDINLNNIELVTTINPFILFFFSPVNCKFNHITNNNTNNNNTTTAETSSVSPGSYCDNCTGSTGGSECESSNSIGPIDSSSNLHRHSIHLSTGNGLMYHHHTNGLEQILSNHQPSILSQSTTSTTSPVTIPSATATLDAASVAQLILGSALDTANVSPLDQSDNNRVTNGTVVEVTGTPLTDCSCGSDQLTNSYEHSSPSHHHHGLLVTTNSTSSSATAAGNNVQVETSPVSIIRSSGTSRKSSKVAFVEPSNSSK